MSRSSTIGRVLLTPSQQRGLTGTSVIGTRTFTESERSGLAQRFGLGKSMGRTFVPSGSVAGDVVKASYLKPGVTSITDPHTGYVAGKGTKRYSEIYKKMQAEIGAAITKESEEAKVRDDLQQASQPGDLAIGRGGAYQTPPSTDIRTPQEKFVATTTRLEQMDMQKRGETLQARGEELFVGKDSELEKHEEAMRVAALTGKPTFKEEKEWRETVKEYTDERDEYLADVREAETRGTIARIHARDLTYAPGVGIPPVPYQYEAPTPIPGAGASFEITGTKPSHFAVKEKDFAPAKQFFETKFPKSPTTPTNQLKVASENLQVVSKGIGETVEGIGKMTPTDILGPTIEDYPTFVEERKKDIRKTAGEGIELFTSPKPPKFVSEGISWDIGTMWKRGVKSGETALGFHIQQAGGMLKFAEVGSKAAGLGFVALGEPVIGSLKDTEVPLGYGFALSPGRFRRGLDIAGQMAWYDALFTAPKAVTEGVALLKGGKIAPGLRIDQPIRYVAKESKYFDDILKQKEISGILKPAKEMQGTDLYKAMTKDVKPFSGIDEMKQMRKALAGDLDIKISERGFAGMDVFGITTEGKKVFGKAEGISRTLPKDTFKFKMARALGLTDEGTKFSRKYTMELLEPTRGKIPDDFAIRYIKTKGAGKDEFQLLTGGRKGEKMYRSFWHPTDEGVIGQAGSFSEAKGLFSKKAIKDIEDVFETTRLVTTSIDDVPVPYLLQKGYPIGGKTQLSTTKMKDLTKIFMKENIELAGETLLPVQKTSALRKLAEKMKIVQPKAIKEFGEFKAKGLAFKGAGEYFDEAGLVAGDVFGGGKGKIVGKIAVDDTSIIFKKGSGIVWKDVVSTKQPTGIYEKLRQGMLKELSGEAQKKSVTMLDDIKFAGIPKGSGLTKELIIESGGKPTFYTPVSGMKSIAGSGTQTITTDALTKTKTITAAMRTMAANFTTSIAKTRTKTFTGTAGMTAFGIGKLATPTKQVEISQIGRQKTVMQIKPAYTESKMIKDFAKVGTIARPITKLRTGTIQKITPVQKISTVLDYSTITKVRASTATKISTVMKIKPIQIQQPVSKIKAIPATKISTRLRTLQRVRTEYKLKIPPMVIPKVDMPPVTPPPYVFPLPKVYKGPFMLKTPKSMGFRLEVRRKGKWMPAFKGVFTEKSAKGLAQQLVGGTPLASFRIAKAFGIPKTIAGLPKFKPEQFRQPIRKGKALVSDIFIEKTKYRIDQPGELRGITYKGLETLALFPKKRKKKGKKKKKKKKRR